MISKKTIDLLMGWIWDCELRRQISIPALSLDAYLALQKRT